VRTAVVTGATGGIGSAVVRALADRGDRVLAIGRSADTLAALDAEPVVLDLSRPFETPPALAGLDRLDALVHCAGIADVASLEQSPPDLWQRTMATNVLGPAELTRALLPALRTTGGRVVFVAIAAGTHAVPNWSAYVASKAALTELAGSLRAEEADLRVTCIYPSGVDTPLLARVRADFGRPHDPAACVRPETLASIVCTVLDCPDDAQITELSVRPAASRSRPPATPAPPGST
jgi:NADP-dependent 3-hydroxy acid dehydrogenase YdfG